MSWLLTTVIWVTWTAGLTSLGVRVLRLFSLELDPLERGVAGAALGTGMFTLSTMIAALAGLYRAEVFWVLFAGCCTAGALSWRQVPAAWQRLRMEPRTWWLALPAGLSVWSFHLIPPFMVDAVVYHLGLPMQGLLEGGWVERPYFLFAWMPANTETLYGAALAVMGEPFVGLVSLNLALLAAGMLWAIVRRASERAAPLAAVLALSMPVTMGLAAYLKSDHAMTLYVLAALWALGLRTRRALVLCGIFVGLAVGTKYTALSSAVAIVCLALWDQRNERAAQGFAVAAITAAAVLVGGAWYLRNLLLKDSPVYPALFGLFGGDGWSEQSARLLHESVALGAGADLTWFTVIEIPWLMVVDPDRIGVFGGPGRLFPLLIGAAIFAVVRWRALRRWLLYAVPVLALWLFTSLNVRYVLPLWFLVCGMAALALCRAPRSWIAPASVALVVAINTFLFWRFAEQKFDVSQYFFGDLTRQQLWDAQVPIAPVARAVEELPTTARLLIVGDARLYPYRRRAGVSSPYERQEIHDLVESQDSVAGLRCAIAARGYTHLIYNNAGVRYLQQNDILVWKDARAAEIFVGLRPHTRVVFRHGPYGLFALEPPECD